MKQTIKELAELLVTDTAFVNYFCYYAKLNQYQAHHIFNNLSEQDKKSVISDIFDFEMMHKAVVVTYHKNFNKYGEIMDEPDVYKEDKFLDVFCDYNEEDNFMKIEWLD